VRVRNNSDRAGKAVAQLYLGFPQATQSPPWQLKGFAQDMLEPGGERLFEITVPASEFRFWDSALGRWRIEPGRYRMRIGSSSRDAVWEGAFSIAP
jgi:beta-glucosidase